VIPSSERARSDEILVYADNEDAVGFPLSGSPDLDPRKSKEDPTRALPVPRTHQGARTMLCTVRSKVLHPNISEQDLPPTPAKPPLPFELQKRAYRVVLAVIVRTRADSGVQDPSIRRPIITISRRRGEVVPARSQG
jgi:hypothetical protein